MFKKKPGIVMIALGIMLLVIPVCYLKAYQPLYQYLTPAPALDDKKDADDKPISSNDPLLAAVNGVSSLKEDLLGVADLLAVHATRPETDFISDERLKLTGFLTAVGGDYFDLYPTVLKSGRMFYPDELKWGDRVALIDELLALKLFRTGEPLGRMLTIGDEEYRIVGVLRQGNRLGTLSEYNCYVPIQQVAREPLQFEALTLSARPIPGAGTGSALTTAVKGWRPGGDMYGLSKEAMRATMPLRVLIFAAFAYLLSRCVRWLAQWVVRQYRAFTQQLETRYLREIDLSFLWRLLVALAGAAMLGGLYFLAISYLVQPVYTFTEYVPKVLVEWREIAKTFWSVQGAQSRTIALRSPELLRTRFFGSLVTGGSMLTLLGTLRLCLGLRANRKKEM